MSGGLRTNLILLVVVGLLASLVWLRPQPSAPQQYKLLEVNGADIAQISLQMAGEPTTIRLQRSGQTWTLVEPVKSRADEGRINRILAVSQEPSSRLLPATQIERYGLTKPLLTLDFDQQRLIFGNLNALTGEQYVLTPRGVMLIQNQTIAPLLVTADDLRDRLLLTASEQPLAIMLNGQKAQRRDGRWEVAGAQAASQDDWTRWLDQWRLLRALRVTQDKLPNDGERLEFELAGSRRVTLQLQKTGDLIRVLREDEGLVYDFSAKIMQPLLKFPVEEVR